MKLQKIKQGRNKGQVSLKATLETLAPGESFTTTCDRFAYDYVRTRAAQIGRRTGRTFATSHTLEMGRTIVITRTK